VRTPAGSGHTSTVVERSGAAAKTKRPHTSCWEPPAPSNPMTPTRPAPSALVVLTTVPGGAADRGRQMWRARWVEI